MVQAQGPGDVVIATELTNPTAATIRVRLNGGPSVDVGAGQTEQVIQVEATRPRALSGTMQVTMTSVQGEVAAVSQLSHSSDLAEAMGADAAWGGDESRVQSGRTGQAGRGAERGGQPNHLPQFADDRLG